ncbi:MAG: glucose-6-phosphate isomerase [Deltaproteobacteria bacterium]|nr:glucose-6-phosphate isomerase [Deltaproteobacteria bacterium]
MNDLPSHPGFTSARAYARLKELAATGPYNLSRGNPSGGITPQRIESCRVSGCGLELVYATQRVDRETLETLAALASETGALTQLKAMMGGAVLNRIQGLESENRRVLHTSSRDVFDDLRVPAGDESRAEDRQAAESAAAEAAGQLRRLEEMLNRLENRLFTDIINIGIGGSDLGPQAVFQALSPWHRPGRQAHFVSNLDPGQLDTVLRQVDPSRTLVVVVSKSGSTQETLANEKMAHRVWQQAGLRPEEHFICVTGMGSPLDDGERYLERFLLPDYVGGRFSVTSMAGGVSLGFALGMENFRALLRGAREMDLHALSTPVLENLPLLAALLGIWNRNFLGSPSLAVVAYSQALSRFVAHLQQLDMESNGKSLTRRGEAVDYDTGPVVWGEPGTNAQHAFFQFLHQSRSVVPVEFIGFRRPQREDEYGGLAERNSGALMANMLAQSLALARGRPDENPNRQYPGNRPSSLLLAERLDPGVMGALLSFYEHKVAFQGFIWDINSFDQEGVELGKTMAEAVSRAWDSKGDAGGGEGDEVIAALLKAAGLL